MNGMQKEAESRKSKEEAKRLAEELEKVRYKYQMKKERHK